jgi:peptidyl-prolyl cis-trans isomerase SurA
VPRLLSILLAAALATAASASLPRAAAAEAAGVVDRIAAVVDDEIILLSELRERVRPQLRELEKAAARGGGSLLAGKRAQLVEQTLQQMINDVLVAQQARKMKLTVSREEVERAIENMARENGVDLKTFRRALEARGKDLVTYRAEMRRDLLKYKVINLRVRGRVKISEEEAREYYNDQVREVRATGGFEGAHILVRVPREARAAEVARKRERAERIAERIRGGESFAEIARDESDDSATAPRGGRLGELRPGVLPEVIDDAFLDLEPGEITGPIRTPAGFHVIRLIDREYLGVQPFSEVKHRIVNQLMQQEMARQQEIWLEDLQSRTFVDVRL